jgi:hypothetical protein
VFVWKTFVPRGTFGVGWEVISNAEGGERRNGDQSDQRRIRADT